jgi:hypothetical protein
MNTDKLSLAVPTFSYYYFAVVLFAIFLADTAQSHSCCRSPVHCTGAVFRSTDSGE